MTLEKIIPFYQAHKEGKAVEFRNVKYPHAWMNVRALFNNDLNCLMKYEFRMKPEYEIRPWSQHEVPLGIRIRNKIDNGHSWGIIGVYKEGVSGEAYTRGKIDSVNYHALCQYYEYTYDNITWKPCGRIVE